MVKTIEAKVEQVKKPKRKSKGIQYPWQVWAVRATSGVPCWDGEFQTRAEALSYVKQCSDLICPVIVHIEIPPMEY